MWYIAQLAIMGAVTALVLPVMPSHNVVAAEMAAWFVALLVTGLSARALWWWQARHNGRRWRS